MNAAATTEYSAPARREAACEREMCMIHGRPVAPAQRPAKPWAPTATSARFAPPTSPEVPVRRRIAVPVARRCGAQPCRPQTGCDPLCWRERSSLRHRAGTSRLQAIERIAERGRFDRLEMIVLPMCTARRKCGASSRIRRRAPSSVGPCRSCRITVQQRTDGGFVEHRLVASI